jgi:hypothetical protein
MNRNIVIITVLFSTIITFTASLSVAGYFYYKNTQNQGAESTVTPILPEPIPFNYFETIQFGGEGGTLQLLDCKKDSYITQILGSSGKYIDSLGIVCSDGSMIPPFGGKGGKNFSQILPGGISLLEIKTGVLVDNLKVTLKNENVSISFGGQGGKFNVLDCGKGLLSGLKIREGIFIDKIGAICRISK